jgi:hypothetical protein
VLPSSCYRELQLTGVWYARFTQRLDGRLNLASCALLLCRCTSIRKLSFSSIFRTMSRHSLQMLRLQRCVYSALNDKFGGTAVVGGSTPADGAAGGDQPQRCPVWQHDGECARVKRAAPATRLVPARAAAHHTSLRVTTVLAAGRLSEASISLLQSFYHRHCTSSTSSSPIAFRRHSFLRQNAKAPVPRTKRVKADAAAAAAAAP